MNAQKKSTFKLNLDLRILAVFLLVVGVLSWAYVQARAQSQTTPDIPDTNNPASQPQSQPAPIQSNLAPQQQPPEPGMLPNTNLEWIRPDELGISSNNQAQSLEPNASPTYPRHYYLTNNSYTCDQVLTACALGYHTASLWEILDVTSLIYDYDQPAAYTQTDSGWGPPSYWYGWIRTGWINSTSSTTGSGNCNNWTSKLTTDYGVGVRLSRTWESAPGDIFVWDATSFTCNYTGPVWCVKN